MSIPAATLLSVCAAFHVRHLRASSAFQMQSDQYVLSCLFIMHFHIELVVEEVKIIKSAT